ncbi:MAG: hypothetical protein IJ060_02385, partial [Oscillospiraceae bacterium]|nr:hypothetical protein [Oscillospiraceae bacterium]
MKKLISVVSSLCLAATSLFSSFSAVPQINAAAAGDIILDLVPAGVEYELQGNNNVATVDPGATVKVNYTVKNDAVTSGMEFTFDVSEVSYVTGSLKAGRAYEAEMETNETAGALTFVMASSMQMTATDGATIVTFTVTAPTENGTYTIGLKDGARAIVAGFNKGETNPYQFHGLTLKVGESTDTTSSTSTTTTSSSQPTGDEIVLDLIAAGKTNTLTGSNNVAEVKPGETVKVNYTVKNDKITSGMEFTFDIAKAGVTYVADTFRAGRAYDAEMETNDATAGQLTFVMASSIEMTAEDGATIVTFSVTVPEDEGEYTIGLKDGARAIVAGFNKGETNPYIFHGLTLKVVAAEDTTTTTQATTTTTTTTSAPILAGSAQWVIDTQTVAAGAEVKLPVIVTDAADGGAAGFRVSFTYDSALEFTGFSWGDQYTAADDAILNKTDLYVVWASPNAADQVANGDVLYFNFIAPDAAGEYPVEF